jgi:hypothetical protein
MLFGVFGICPLHSCPANITEIDFSLNFYSLKVMLVQSNNMYMVAALSDNPIESLNLWQSLTGQQENFCEAFEVKAAHSEFFMYGKLPLLYTSDSSSQASRLKDGILVLMKEVADEARIGAITAPMDFIAP